MMTKKHLQLLFLISITCLLFACATQVEKVKPKVVEPKKEVPEDIRVTPLVKKNIPVPVPESVIKKSEPERESVLILLSSSAGSYQKVATFISDSLGDNAVQITLSGLPAQDRAVINDIENSTSTQIVALGLKAVNAVKNIQTKQIVYTQVINHKGLLAKNIKAVCALPSPEKLFKDWKKLSPSLSKVAVITGDNLDSYLNRASIAAKKQGIELVVVQVSTDKGFVYKSKKLSADIGGQWILPDNRVLSGKALKEVMAFSSRRGRQMVVFSPKLLSFGGFFYVSPDLEEIAKGVLQRLTDSAGQAQIKGKNVLPIKNHLMGINQNIAKQFNLTIPDEYQAYLNE